MSFLPAITVCCSTLHVSPHQHSSITRSIHNFQQQLSCHTVPDPIPRRKAYMCCQYNVLQPPQGFSTTTGRGFAPSSGTVMQLLEGMWLFGFCLLHTLQLHPALVPTPCAAPATPPMAPLQHPEQCHTQRPRALEGKSHSPLNISVHQQPDQYPCHGHQDWVMVHALQPYGNKRER